MRRRFGTAGLFQHSFGLPDEVQQVCEQRSAATRNRLSDRDKSLLQQTHNDLLLLLSHEPPEPEAAVLPLVRKLLKSCPWPSECLAIQEDHGTTLLQLSVIRNYPDIAEYFISLGAEVNAVDCGRPLHLACKLGHVEMVRRLMALNADPTLLSKVCYPHDPTLREVRPLKVFHCGGMEVALAYALRADSVDCVKAVCGANMSLQCGLTLLGFACDVGAVKCVSYLCKFESSQVNVMDSRGLLPIHYAVKWGTAIMEILVLSGASVLIKTPQRQTLLHLLMGDACQHTTLSQSAEFLLSCGLIMNVNALSADGETALRLLMLRLRNTANKQLQSELLRTLQLLLEARANPNIGCRSGIRPALILFECNPSIVSFQTTEEVLILLVKRGVNLNLASQENATTTEVFLKNACKWLLTSGSHIEELPHFRRTLDLICENSHGMLSTPYRACCLDILTPYMRDRSQTRLNLFNLLGIMRAVIHSCCRLAGCQSHTDYFVFDFFSLVMEPQMMRQALPYAEFQMAMVMLLHNPSLQDCREAVHAHSLERVVTRLLVLLRGPVFEYPCCYSAMDLLQLLLVCLCHLSPKVMQTFLRNQVANCESDGWNSAELHIRQFLVQLARSPVSLKHAAANSIYRYMDHRMHFIESLPLPKEIKQYISNLEYVKISC